MLWAIGTDAHLGSVNFLKGICYIEKYVITNFGIRYNGLNTLLQELIQANSEEKNPTCDSSIIL